MLFTQNAHRNAIRQRRRFLSALEMLEDRRVPSTLTVTSAADDGSAGTLRATIAAAHDNDTIQFAAQLKGKTITLTRGALVISQNLDIFGPGANRLTISGNSGSRVFDVGQNNTVTIAGLTIANGVVGSIAAGDAGGGIENEAGATLYLLNDVVSNNTAYGIGGGLWDQPGATANISNTTFVGNKALGSLNFTYPAEGFSPGNGTAEGGAIDNDGTANVSNSTFADNLAAGAAGGSDSSAHGGAIGSDGPLTVSGSGFTGNQALGALVPAGNTTTTSSEGIGGAIVAFDTTTISNSTFTHNEAHGGDGGIGYVLNEHGIVVSTFRGIGGAIAMQGVTAVVTGSSFDGNQAVGGAGGPGSPGSLGIGGGLDADFGSNLTVSDSSFSGNSAVGGAGANKMRWDGAGIGGGLSIAISSSATLTDIAVTGDQALGGAGYAGSNGGSAYGGGLSVGSRWIWDHKDGTSVSLSDSTITKNLALGGDGGLGRNGGNGLGGGVFIGGTLSGLTPSLTATDSSITHNEADGGEEGKGGNDGQGVSGGVYNLGVFTVDPATVVKKNRASIGNDDVFP
jgi:hypothetical protein